MRSQNFSGFIYPWPHDLFEIFKFLVKLAGWYIAMGCCYRIGIA